MTSSLTVSYPYEDDLGFIWVDSNTFLADKEEPCFMCKAPTKRLDIHFEGHYCGSAECEEAIRRDLEKLNSVFTEEAS